METLFLGKNTDFLNGITLSIWNLNTSGYELNEPDKDFFDLLSKDIDKSSTDLILFCNQESLKPGDYLHSYHLPEYMETKSYKILNRQRYMGISTVAIKTFLNSGKIGLRGLRTSIYCKSSLYDKIISWQDMHKKIIGNGMCKYESCLNSTFMNKGSLACYIYIPGIGLITFINCHLPFSEESLIEYKEKKDIMIRNNEVMRNNIEINNLIKSLCGDISSYFKTDVIFLIGDLNYRVILPDNITLNKDNYVKLCEKHDEFSAELKKENIYQLKEGRDNAGVNFIPTCNFKKGRDSDTFDYYNSGKLNQRSPSYCDRILYNTMSDKIKITCNRYDSYSTQKIKKDSDHIGVYGNFTIYNNI